MRPLSYLMIGIWLWCVACNTDKKSASYASPKFNQYMYHGEQLYSRHCLNCHQKDGSGLGLLIPPLTTTFLNQQKNTVICGIKYGMKGPMTINGSEYNGIMPAMPRLTPLEVAEIMTYVSNTWGNDYGMISISEVETALRQCND